MASVDVLTAPLVLYSARICPWAQRSTLALKETGLEHSIIEIDLQNKPSWYNTKINPASKVPVLQIGGKDENDENVARIPESHVLLELITEIGVARGTRNLHSEDIIEKAAARYFVERFNQIISGPWNGILWRKELDKVPALYSAIEEIQNLLQERYTTNGKGPFWHGDKPGFADLGIGPFVGRIKVLSQGFQDLKDVHATLFGKPEYKVFADYADAITSLKSWSETFDDD